MHPPRRQKPTSPPTTTISRDIAHFLSQVMLPDHANPNRMIIPISRVASGETNLSCRKFTTNITLNLSALLSDFLTATTPPFLPPQNGDAVPLWAATGSTESEFPLIHVMDGAFPLALPMKTIPGTTAIVPRRFTYSFGTYTNAINVTLVASAEDETGIIELTPIAFPAADSARFPSGFAIRPIFGATDLDDRREYLWFDSNPAIPTICTLRVTLSAAIPSGATMSVRVRYLQADRDGSENAYGETTNFTSGATVCDINTTIKYSGFYALSLRMAVWGYTGVYNPDFTVTLIESEFSDVGTAFWQQRTYCDSLPSVASLAVNLGSSVLYSLRSPTAFSSGTGYGVNVSRTKYVNFFEATAAGRALLSSIAPINAQYNLGSGGNLNEGFWSYSSPQPWMERMFPICGGDDLAGTRPVKAYWVGKLGAPSAINFISLAPAMAQNTEMKLNLQATHLFAFKPINQVVPVSPFQFLKTDEYTAALAMLAATQNFSPNDWHDLFRKVANISAKFGEKLMSGARWVNDVAPDLLTAAGHAATIAAQISAIAAML
jgi:hypothetical protein